MKLFIVTSVILALSFVLSGCGGEPEPMPDAVDNTNGILQTAAIRNQPQEYRLFYEQEYQLALYEPEAGAYIGAYVLSNRFIDYDILTFNEMTGREHAISVYNLNAGNPFPEMWVISCIAAKKTPYFVITPPNDYNPFDHALIDELAGRFGELQIPMFLEFYPITSLPSDTEEYIDFFRYARRRFREKAPNVAFVWATDIRYAAEANRFYPGHQYTDWVGLHAIRPLDGDGYGEDLFYAIDYFYYMYQKVKPIALSRFAVSHYTNDDYIFKNQIAADEITRVYNKIITYYPRIKMINYMDFDESIADPSVKGDYFTVTDTNIVQDAYSAVISDDRFLSSIASGMESQHVVQVMRSPFPVMRIGDYWYASEFSFQFDLNTRGALGGRKIDGRMFYNLNFFARNTGRFLESDGESNLLFMGY